MWLQSLQAAFLNKCLVCPLMDCLKVKAAMFMLVWTQCVPVDAVQRAHCPVVSRAPCCPCWQKHQALGRDSERRKKSSHSNDNQGQVTDAQCSSSVNITIYHTKPTVHCLLCAAQTHLANDVVFIVFLVKGQDGRHEFGNLLLQFFTGHQVAHGAHSLSHS